MTEQTPSPGAAGHVPAPDLGEPTHAAEAGGRTERPVEDLAFDAALEQLQEVVGRLEAGGLPLETSIALYERGVALHAHCARLLGEAELRVQQLVEQAGGGLAAIDLAPDETDDEEDLGG